MNRPPTSMAQQCFVVSAGCIRKRKGDHHHTSISISLPFIHKRLVYREQSQVAELYPRKHTTCHMRAQESTRTKARAQESTRTAGFCATRNPVEVLRTLDRGNPLADCTFLFGEPLGKKRLHPSQVHHMFSMPRSFTQWAPHHRGRQDAASSTVGLDEKALPEAPCFLRT
jgi:hypothetical protein